MTTDDKFPCTKCGLCCRDVRGLGLPTRWDGHTCAHLKPNNLCAIYDKRPPLCRVPNDKWEVNIIMCTVLKANALKTEKE